MYRFHTSVIYVLLQFFSQFASGHKVICICDTSFHSSLAVFRTSLLVSLSCSKCELLMAVFLIICKCSDCCVDFIAMRLKSMTLQVILNNFGTCEIIFIS